MQLYDALCYGKAQAGAGAGAGLIHAVEALPHLAERLRGQGRAVVFHGKTRPVPAPGGADLDASALRRVLHRVRGKILYDLRQTPLVRRYRQLLREVERDDKPLRLRRHVEPREHAPGQLRERKFRARYLHLARLGSIEIRGGSRTVKVNVDEGAEKIMAAVGAVPDVDDVRGEPGTNAGGMLEKVRQVMANLTNQHPKDIMIQDLLAVDTFTPQKVRGGLANEFSQENAVGIAAMVKADRLQMVSIAKEFSEKIGVPVQVGGVEADMAIRGALTTPGTTKPLAILDMGAGSTDASIINSAGEIHSIHLAGAGNMVTLLIQSEMGLDDFDTAEDIKKYPLAKVESLFHIRHENGTAEFFDQPLAPHLFAKVVILKEGKMIPLEGDQSMERIKLIRRQAKEKVFVTNAVRALTKVSPTGNVRDIQFVVLVGGSALDFEVPQLVTDALSQYRVVAGRGNIRGTEGPRNAVATGLVLSLTEGGA